MVAAAARSFFRAWLGSTYGVSKNNGFNRLSIESGGNAGGERPGAERAAEIAGSLGLAESLNAGTDHAMAQAQHGSAPDIAGQDKANPSSLIGSAAMLLAWLGERRDDARLTDAAAAIERALDAAIAKPEWRTGDLGGPLGTKAFGACVAAVLDA